MLPLLQFANDRQLHPMQEAFDALAEELHLTVEDKGDLLPSGTQQTYKNRIVWARTYLTKANLLESPKRGHFQITDRGLDELLSEPDQINTKYLIKYEEFREFRLRTGKISDSEGDATVESATTPEESIENAIEEMNAQLASEILEALLAGSPGFFERVVIELLVKMGYGGIDGIIK